MQRRRSLRWVVALGIAPTLTVWFSSARPGVAAEDAGAGDLERRARSILADACFPCHGPDAGKRKAALRLDLEARDRTTRDGRPLLVPGDSASSEIFRRLMATDKAERMPPASAGRQVAADEIQAIGRWIASGARWSRHWSLNAPARPPAPVTRDPDAARGPIDAFILARLEAEKLPPRPEASGAILARRASLDLAGLPPAPGDVDVFLADGAPDAYERLVDRLLASSRLGERLTERWLDAARYADTNGYQTDGERQMWRWRDWVIEAFNANLPFDRFTIEQTAGDLLPGATLEQRIATGFHRNHRGNAEGGIIAEEYAVEYVADRVDTFATVWLGLTLGCARCHDHKFDPISQREYYGLFAFFNNVPEHGRAVKFGNSPPFIRTPTREQAERLASLDAAIAMTEEAVRALEPQVASAQAAWEAREARSYTADWFPRRALTLAVPCDGFAAGPVGQATVFDAQRFLDLGDVGAFGFLDKLSLAAWVQVEADGGGAIVSRGEDVPQGAGYELRIQDGRAQLNLVKRWLDDALRVETETRLESGRWQHVTATYDGSRTAAGVRIYVDGVPQPLRVLLDELNQSFATKEPLRIAAGGGPAGRFRGSLDEVRVYSRSLEASEAAHLACAKPIASIAAAPASGRTTSESAKLRAAYLDAYAAPSVREVHARLAAFREERERLVDSIPTTMVLEEMPRRRPTFVLLRGEYDKRGEEVSPGVPGCLPPLSPELPRDRLSLARWLVDPSHPLTARVAANRWWQMLLGAGLVRTTEDFGVQGEPPAQPAVLDWLAVELVATGWDVKRLLRTIVTSAAYRRDSSTTPELLERDPENRLLARGPRFRLAGGTLRDQALHASGLLVERLGGPPARPYQPPGLWKDLNGLEDYVPDRGEGLHRRSLYTFWKRTAPPPTLMAFDAAPRETCVVRESRTNTPLQALALLNDVTFVEAARALAIRACREAGDSPDERIVWMFRSVLARRPTVAEAGILAAGMAEQTRAYRARPAAAQELLAAGDLVPESAGEPAEIAALAIVASTMASPRRSRRWRSSPARSSTSMRP